MTDVRFGAVLVLAAAFIMVGPAPARAESVTIDSSNCSSPDACYGLSWTLTVNTGSFSFGGETFAYEAILTVADDPLIGGVPTHVISAVDFKVASSVDDGVLYSFPGSSSNWSTGINVLNSAGCTGPEAGFVCSDTATDPANFTGAALTWGWYFDTSEPLFAGLQGAHIGAKLTDLSRPGKLLSEEFRTNVPEPSSLALLMLGFAGVLASRRRAAGAPRASF